MALAFTAGIRHGSAGNHRVTTTVVALDNLYTTGGYVLTAANLGLSQVSYGTVNIKATVAAGPAAGYLDCTNKEAPKLVLQAAGAAAEVAANATLTASSVGVTAYGFA